MMIPWQNHTVIWQSMRAGGFGMAMLALLASPIASGTAQVHSTGVGQAHPRAATVIKPLIDLSEPADVDDIVSHMFNDLNGAYDQYLAFKSDIQNQYNIQFSMPVSMFVQWGTPNGTPGVAELAWSPSVTWTPFNNTTLGSGTFTFAFQSNQFWTHANTGSQKSSMGLLTPPNYWASDAYQFAQITYTQTNPGNWLAVSAGQYSFGQYDGNQYAGDAQTNFINYALAQNATQTYANAGIGTYVQITANPQLQLAGGLQNATDITGENLTTSGFDHGQIAYFMNVQWTPTVLPGSTFNMLYYIQPSVPLQPGASQGVSFSAVENLSSKYGLFLRVNNASGNVTPINTSVAFGGIVNNPFGRNRRDQSGIGAAWNKMNDITVERRLRSSEWMTELYYSYSVFKALQITPDLQFYFNPALAPSVAVAVVFSARATFRF